MASIFNLWKSNLYNLMQPPQNKSAVSLVEAFEAPCKHKHFCTHYVCDLLICSHDKISITRSDISLFEFRVITA